MRLGIVGSDNTHALGFTRLINVDQRFGPDVRVTAISPSADTPATSIAQEAAIPEIVASPEEMVQKVDGVIIVDRDGGLHLRHAEPFINARVPLLVDKPLSTSVSDAAALLQLARQSGAMVTSYSSLRWCQGTSELKTDLANLGDMRFVEVSGPCDLDSPYGGHFFYGIHLAEIALTLSPGPVDRVRVVQGPGVATVVIDRADLTISLNLLNPNLKGEAARFPFYAIAIGTESFTAREIQSQPDLYQSLLKFLQMMRTGVAPLSDEEMLEPILLLEAVSVSLGREGRGVAVSELRPRL